MKQFKLLYLILFVSLAFVGCDEYENSAEPSTIIYLPKITLTGESTVYLECDATSFVDEGAVAEEGGTEISVEKEVHGVYFGGTSVDSPDVYSITYLAYSSDSIPTSTFRTVVWPVCNGDMINSIAGTYTAAVTRDPASVSFADASFGPYLIKDLGGGKYQLSDAIGGWYEYGYGYGSDYASPGMTITANDITANDFTFDGSSTLPWGGEILVTSFTVDPVAKTITFTTDWELGYVFSVTLTQVE